MHNVIDSGCEESSIVMDGIRLQITLLALVLGIAATLGLRLKGLCDIAEKAKNRKRGSPHDKSDILARLSVGRGIVRDNRDGVSTRGCNHRRWRGEASASRYQHNGRHRPQPDGPAVPLSLAHARNDPRQANDRNERGIKLELAWCRQAWHWPTPRA